jgi:predicted small metal-binding protein
LSIKLVCKDYGFECNYSAEGEKGSSVIEKLRKHFEDVHGIDYSSEFLIQMIINKGHSRGSITK